MKRGRAVTAAVIAVVAVGFIATSRTQADPIPTPTPTVLHFTATDFAFDGPATAEAGYVTVRMTNSGQEPHHITLVRLEEGRTVDDLHQAMASGAHTFPEWAVDVGGPSAAVPGQTIEAGLVLEEGSHVLLCLINSADGVLHVMKGMAAELTVTRGEGRQPAPRVDTEMTLRDYAFTLSQPLQPGTQTIRVRTGADQSHEVLVVRLEPGKTARDFVEWVEHPQGPPPGLPLGGVASMAVGQWNDLTLTLEPGRHALICFLTDREDGKPHFQHGMMMEVEV